MAAAVAATNAQLPPEDRAKSCVYAQNYGEAAAIDYFGPELGLPPAICLHNSYWMWGPGSCDGAVVLIIGGDREDHIRYFSSVEPGGVFDCTDCMPYEDNLTIWVARDHTKPVAEAWGESRHYD
jgi:hypothetical protein